MPSARRATISGRVVVTGAAGRVGRRVCSLLAERDALTQVVAVDARPLTGLPDSVTRVVCDLADVDLASVLADATVVVHLAAVFKAAAEDIDVAAEVAADLAIARRLIDATATTAVDQLVVLSSAMVYGAWPANPVPVTEEAPMRPNPEFAFAVGKAELERVALEWRVDRADSALTVLRPAVIVATDRPGRLARLLHDAAVVSSSEGDPPMQFVHADDVASAVVASIDHRVDGVLNVAPDGWLSAADFRALAGPKPRVRVPGGVARTIFRARRRLGIGASPPGLVPYTTYPWVVANDRLKGLGWHETSTNAEAYVVAHDAGPLDRITARRRQEIALGVMVAAIVATIVATVAIVRRVRHRAD